MSPQLFLELSEHNDALNVDELVAALDLSHLENWTEVVPRMSSYQLWLWLIAVGRRRMAIDSKAACLVLDRLPPKPDRFRWPIIEEALAATSPLTREVQIRIMDEVSNESHADERALLATMLLGRLLQKAVAYPGS